MKHCFSFFIFFVLTTGAFADQQPADSTDTTLIKLELKDGSILFGTIVNEDSLTIEFKTLSNIFITVPHYQIKYKIPAGQTEKETLRVVPTAKKMDRNSSHLFLMSTGRPIPKGQTNFSIYELFFPSFAVGLTDFLSVSGGISLIPGLANQLLYYGGKLTPFQSSVFSLSVGTTWFASLEGSDNNPFFYGVGTIGSDKLSFTVGTAGNFARSSDDNYIIFGAELQLSERAKFLTENWFVGKGRVTSFGIRSFGENISADFGLITTLEEHPRGFPFLPWVGFSYAFGKPSAAESENFGEEAEPYPASLYRIIASYDFIAFGSISDYKEIFERHGFTVPDRSSSVFSSGYSDENISNGSGIFIQLERTLTPIYSGGITISTLGAVLGSKAVQRGFQYFPYNYYGQTGVQEEHSIVSFAIHATAYPAMSALARKNISFFLGAGAGLSFIDSELRVTSYSSPPSVYSFTAPTGLLFFGLEQRISKRLSLGVRIAYIIIPEQTVGDFSKSAGSYFDYSTSPPQEKPITITLPSHSANFSFGKFGFTIGVYL